MTRIKGWEKRLKEVVEKHSELPSQYGVSDCYLIADDVVEAVTGQQMYPDARDYTSELGAAKKLQQHGFMTVEDAFAAKFEIIPASIAQRGDIGVVENNGNICGGAFTSIGFMTRDKDKIAFMLPSQIKTAFKVGR